jgi:NAD(P)-dependent dehydrogenase (short-subunit alcohol dehydrogenase family)
MGLSGRNAVVTGGASGIGRAIALRLARDGADVAILDVNHAGAEEVAREVRAAGRRAAAFDTDVSSATRVEAALAGVRRDLGPVHILVNDAGIAEFVPVVQMTEAQWDRMLAVHLKGTFLCTRGALPDMITAGWGRIVNVSSVGGLRGGPALAHYAAAKAGMIGFTKAVAIEVGPQGITVNALAPGLVDTPLLRGSRVPEGIYEHARRETPMRRIGTPDDIAAACAYLVSEEASFFTGQVVSPNGGGYL